MKTCTNSNCTELNPQPLSSFYFNSQRKTYESKCKTCLKIAGKIRYKTNDAHRKIRDARIEKIREENRQLVLDYLREHPCIDCGEADPIVLQFDHRNPKDKKKAVANLVRYYSTEVVGTEIAKCDVRCANCHIRRTGKQFGWWKNDKKYGTS